MSYLAFTLYAIQLKEHKKKKKKWTEDGLKNHKIYYMIKIVKPIEDKTKEQQDVI